MAQQGYGLSNAVGGFFDVYFKAKEMRMKEDQFNRNMAEEQRQFSLLQAYRDAQLMSKQPTTEYQNFSQEGYYKVEPGKEPTYIQNQNKPMGTPKTITSMIRQGNEFVTYEHQEWTSPMDGRVIGKSPIREGSAGSDGLTAYQQMMQDERKQKRIEKNTLNVDSLIKVAQEGSTPLKDKSGKEVKNANGETKKVYQIGDKTLPKELWKPKATSAVNSLLSDYGLVNVKNKILSGAKVAAKKQGIDFDSAKPETKREYLKKLLDKNQEIPEEEKDVLYKFVEVYTR